MFPNFNYWPWVALLLALGGLYGVHRYYVHEAVQQNTVQIEQKYQTKLDQAEKKNQATTDELRINANNLQKDRDGKIADINAKLDNANRLLRQRPSRTEVSTAAPVGSSCTGTQLYREDGLFLRGEAARAEALIVERDYYWKAYEDARKKDK